MHSTIEAKDFVDRLKPLLPSTATIVAVDHQGDGIDVKIRCTQGARGSLARIEEAVVAAAESMRQDGNLKANLNVTAIATY